jgi:copper homeostasis protein
VTVVEICVDDVGGAAAAAAGGADRVELCAALAVGGLTPTPAFVSSALEEAPTLAHRVLVRPRPGDFVFSPAEVAVMCADIHLLQPLDVGFVVGASLASGELDAEALARLVEACAGAPVACHKAFDLVPDVAAALDLLVELGFTTVLTSGGPGAATDHLARLAEIVERADDRIEVLVGGGVRPSTVRRILDTTGAGAVHLRAQADGMPAGGFGERRVTDADLVTRVVAEVAGR